MGKKNQRGTVSERKKGDRLSTRNWMFPRILRKISQVAYS